MKRLKADEATALATAIKDYRALATQCSNTAFNLAQKLRAGEGGYTTTFAMIRDYDRAENRLVELLKDCGLWMGNG
jgi:hypothetical protein